MKEIEYTIFLRGICFVNNFIKKINGQNHNEFVVNLASILSPTRNNMGNFRIPDSKSVYDSRV